MSSKRTKFVKVRTGDQVLQAIQDNAADVFDQLEDIRRGVIAYPARKEASAIQLGEDAVVSYTGSAAVTWILPAATVRGRGRSTIIIVTHSGPSGSLTILPAGTDTLAAPVALPVGAGVALVSDGYSRWTPVGLSGVGGPSRFDVSETIPSATGALWDGLDVGGTATITGLVTPISTPGGVNEVTIRRPVLTSVAALTVSNAATLKIEGGPTAAGALIITNPYAIWAAGNSLFDRVFTGPATAGAPAFSFQGAQTTGFFNPNGTTSVAISVGGVETMRWTQTNQNVLIGTTIDTASTKFKVFLTKTVASAAAALWDGFNILPQTCTISGNTGITTASGFNAVRIGTPTLSAALALTVDQAATLTVIAAPIGGGAGPCTITRPYTIWAQAGNSRFASLEIDLNTRVSAQFDKVANTTLNDVTGLTATLVAGATYAFEAILFVTASAAGGSKYTVAGTTTATAIIYDITLTNEGTSALAITSRQTALGGAAGQAGATSGLCWIAGLITVNAAGTLTVQFAQNVANGTSSVLVGSHFKVERIA